MNFLASKAQLRASFIRWALLFVPLIVLLGFGFGRLGGPDTVWFQSLVKPDIFPPPAAFGIVWALLYVAIGFAIALVASAWGAPGRSLALGLMALHLPFNFAWTPVFFGAQQMQTGLMVLVAGALSLMPVIALFWRVRRLAGLLLIPYFAWVCFAALLNYQFIVENPDGGVQSAQGGVQRIEL